MMARAWFDQNKAQAILIESTTPLPEELLWKGLKAQTFAPDPDHSGMWLVAEWSELKGSDAPIVKQTNVRFFHSADG